jgi:hypothetical protein
MTFYPELKTLYVVHVLGEPEDLAYSLIIGWASIDSSSSVASLYPWIARQGGVGADNSWSVLKCITDIVAITSSIPQGGVEF